MMNQSNNLKACCLIGSMIALSACDAVVDCFDNDGPVFDTRALVPAILNQEYLQRINVSVNNEPRDDRFDYQFRLTGGSLPAGISAEPAGRSLVLSGTPTELGTFAFTINVEVDDGLSPADSGLCYRIRDREFSLPVVQEGETTE